MRSDTAIELWHVYRAAPPRKKLTRWIAVGLGLAWLAVALFGCSSGPSPADQADLVSLSQAIETATTRTLTADEAALNQAALQRLGVSLADVERARVAGEIWDVARPILTAGIGFLLGGS